MESQYKIYCRDIKIDAIYIFNSEGIRLVNVSSKKELLDADLVTGFFTAIKQFTSGLFPGNEVQSLTLHGYLVFFKTIKDITFCIQASSNTPKKIIEFIIFSIAEDFFNLYEDILKNWNYDVEIFNEFRIYLMQYLEKPIIDKILDELGYNTFAEEFILYDDENDKVIIRKLKNNEDNKSQICYIDLFINFVKDFSEKFEDEIINCILISTNKRYLCIAKKYSFYAIILFPKSKEIEWDIILKKTEKAMESLIELANEIERGH